MFYNIVNAIKSICIAIGNNVLNLFRSVDISQILMNSDAPLSISQLAGRFSSRTFTLEMRAASGGNEQGLRKFLTQYPSLWLDDRLNHIKFNRRREVHMFIVSMHYHNTHIYISFYSFDMII